MAMMADGLVSGGLTPCAETEDVAGDGTTGPIPRAVAQELVAAGQRMDRRGWVPATSGNLSARLAGERMAITRSGVHKGFLDIRDIIEVDFAGRSHTPGMKPSAETLLHCQIYALWPQVGSVLHGHSVAATALTMALSGADELRLDGYEILKAWGDIIATHDVSIALPIIDNDQDMPRLAAKLQPLLEQGLAPIGYVLRGHGIYVWGSDVNAALYRLEALEFLLETEIERRKLV
jgi:methylthioribulose-1-phosphate dehydratase